MDHNKARHLTKEKETVTALCPFLESPHVSLNLRDMFILCTKVDIVLKFYFQRNKFGIGLDQ